MCGAESEWGDCAGGAIGGAASAIAAPLIRDTVYADSPVLNYSDDPVRQALTVGLATLIGGATGALLGTDDLASKMAKPVVSDAKLGGLIDDLYRDGAKIGTGSTADAVRYETQTGNPVGGVFHTQKAQDYSVALQKMVGFKSKCTV